MLKYHRLCLLTGETIGMNIYKKSSKTTICAVLIGIAVNVGLALIMYISKVPLYLDTIGTIVVSMVAGFFPGVLTAVFSSVLCALFNPFSVYYSVIAVLIAFFSVLFRKKYKDSKKRVLYGLLLALIFAVISGGLGALIQILLLGQPQFDSMKATADLIFSSGGPDPLLSFFFLNIALNFVDKAISLGAAYLLIHFIPKEKRELLNIFGWKQKPRSDEELREFSKNAGRKNGFSTLQTRMSLILMIIAVAMTIVMATTFIQVYRTSERRKAIESAKGAANLVGSMLDLESIPLFERNGRNQKGYDETYEMLMSIKESIRSIKYLYVFTVTEEGTRYLFDMEADNEGNLSAYEPGTLVPFENAVKPYVSDLLKGKEVGPVESNDIWGRVVMIYHPVEDKDGNTVCYVGADVSVVALSEDVRDYLLRTILIFSGFFILVMAFGLFNTKYYLVHPINSMADCAGDFEFDTTSGRSLRDNVKKIKGIGIETGDEIEILYKTLCRMTEDTADQVTDIRHHTKQVEEMQSGLIITMADMVESRDSDTGFHVQKTAEYVRIILNGLKGKGYYSDKMTEKYMEDVVMSAPLHDIGKINIPDAVLNKPGRLTKEEFEIMKRHTTEGKKILEKAINSVKGGTYLREALSMAAYHHERYDGKGYPEGLSGTVIPLSARIMAVADVFDALTSKRIYKPSMTYEEAMQIITEGSGTQFDPKCVEVFVESEDAVRKVLRKYQDKE